MRRLAILHAALALLALCAASSATAKPLSQANRQFVDAAVEQVMQQNRLPGVAIMVSGPKGSYSRAYGVADLATGAPMRLDDHVRVGSITKTFTATAILEQVQAGKLKLSDKLSHWIGGIPNGNRITVRDLLSMRSGIYDYTSDAAFEREFEANPQMPFGLGDVLAIIRRHAPLFPPGARTSYADSNYYLLGAILERITGMSAEAAITKGVIKPLGLKHTSFPTTAKMPHPFSLGYFAGDDGKGPIEDYTALNPALAWTAGSIVSTVGDLRKYGKDLATGALLSPRLQAQRLRLGALPNAAGGPPAGYGLGILGAGDWLGHDGAILGFSAETFYDPHTGAQIVAAANLCSNFAGPTMEIFGQVALHLYPASLKPA